MYNADELRKRCVLNQNIEGVEYEVYMTIMYNTNATRLRSLDDSM